MRTGGKRIGIAAEASAWSGPMTEPRITVRGGAVEAERLAHAEAEHAAEVELGPQIDEAADPDGGVGEVRGEEAGVDCADRGAAEDVEVNVR